ncbi:SDR family oxidoreductase [Kribbella sp. ALI-6-A]|uniref:SDR family oxidoreductase n=1 Tax=Kribbella sp. ALI-6-A TaxID=1933817 RepID=UPI001EDC1640|nr:SDR family oxidoreductase [Kribbella sp. ALI-6-A]
MATLDDKVIAITGASSGIGAATARRLGRAGAAVVLGARRKDRLEALAEEIRAAGGRAATVAIDVTDPDDVRRLVQTAVTDFGRLDVLVSSAGIGPISPMAARRAADWDAMIDVNLRGVLHGIDAALPIFEAQGRGHFVTIVSTAGLKITPTMAVYGATKNAVRTVLEDCARSRPTERSRPPRSPLATSTPSSPTRSPTQPSAPKSAKAWRPSP